MNETPVYVDGPLETAVIKMDETASLVMQMNSDDIASPGFLTVRDQVNGKEVVIPENMIVFLAHHGVNAVRKLNWERERACQLSCHPSHYAKLSFVDEKDTVLVSEGDDMNIELTPVISWYKNDEKDMGWRLHLVGAEKVKLMSAAWNDEEKILKMAQTVKDKDALFVMVSLTDSNLARRLSSRQAATKLKQGRAIPRMELKELRKILEEKSLTSRNSRHYSGGGMGNLAIKINNQAVRVAVKIRPPDEPVFSTEFEDDPKMSHAQRREAREARVEENHIEWRKRFEAAILGTGWRIVDLRDPNSRNSYYDSKHAFWVTKISPNEFAPIREAAMLEARNTRGIPSKF